MQIVYNGPHPEVVVDEFDQDTVITAGTPVEIPDDLAARLLEQSTWSVPETPSQKKAREKQQADEAQAAADEQAKAVEEATKAVEAAAATAIEEGRVVEIPEPVADETSTEGSN